MLCIAVLVVHSDALIHIVLHNSVILMLQKHDKKRHDNHVYKEGCKSRKSVQICSTRFSSGKMSTRKSESSRNENSEN